MKKNALLWLISGLCLVPFFLMLLNSIRIDGEWSLRQFGILLFQTPRFFQGFWNSVCYTGLILAFNVPLSLAAAYGFSRFHFRGRKPLFWLYIVIILLPFQATVVPQYLTLKWLGILNTMWAVILPNLFTTFGTFLMVQYMQSFDKTLYEAAEIDGMGTMTVFLQLVLPVCKPVIGAMAIVSFLNYWSLVEQPLMFLEDSNQHPLSVLLNSTNFGEISFAAGVVFSFLPLLLYIYMYEDIQAGMGMTGSVYQERKEIQINHKRKKRALYCLKAFGITMIVLTLATQKITDIMMPKVSVYTIGRTTSALQGYQNIVPTACVIKEGGQSFILIVMPASGDKESMQVLKTQIQVKAENEGYCSVSGSVKNGQQVICHSSKPIENGEFVKVIGEAFYEEKLD